MNRKKLALTLLLACTAGLAPTANAALFHEPETAPAATVEKKHDEQALAIIDAYIEKIGGKDLIASIESTKVEATVEIPMIGMTGTMTLVNKTPGKMSMVMELPGFGKTESGYDGEVGWNSDPMNGPRLMTEEEIADLGSQADPNAAAKYRETYSVIEYGGEADFNAQKVHKIRLVRPDGRESTEYYSVESGLLVGQESIQASQMGEIKIISQMSDYKEFGGMKAPTVLTQLIGPQKIVMKINKMEINSVDDSAFNRPEAVQKLVDAKAGG